MGNKTSIMGTVTFMYSDPNVPCVCCPDGHHAYSRRVQLDGTDYFDASDFVRKVAAGHGNDGKRVKITVEVLEGEDDGTST